MSLPVDPDSFGFLVTDLSRLIRAEMDRRVAEAGLGVTAGEARALAHAARSGSVRQNVLAERMGIEAMTVSGYIDRLEARGLVRRRTDPADGRARLVELTPSAEIVLAAVRSIAAGLTADAARSIPRRDWDLLIATLKAARASLAGLRAADRTSDAA
jgi:DNA-binding MarR family transcriptional regulator